MYKFRIYFELRDKEHSKNKEFASGYIKEFTDEMVVFTTMKNHAKMYNSEEQAREDIQKLHKIKDYAEYRFILLRNKSYML